MQEDLFGEAHSRSASHEANSEAGAGKRRGETDGASVGLASSAAKLSELAQRLPASLRFGVSTWSYPGWEGLVWDDVYSPTVLSKQGLKAYHRHPLMRTVCVDRTFWRPLTVSQYADYAAQVDDDFRFVVKCPSLITDALRRSSEGKPREPNPDFLNADLAVTQFVQPTVAGLGEKLGVLVFQLSPLDWGLLAQPDILLDRLGKLLLAVRTALPAQSPVIVAVEVRDPELLNPALVDTLKAGGATFCLGLHGKMPPIEAQLPVLRALWPGPLVCRWNLNRIFGPYGYAAAQKKHDPFNAIVSEDTHTRAVLARTIRGITGAGQAAYVTVSNDAEGCSPLSIEALARAVVEGQE